MPQKGPLVAAAAEISVSGFTASTFRSQDLAPPRGDEETEPQHPVTSSSEEFESGAHLFLHSSYTSGQRIRFEYNGRAAAGTVDTATDDDSVVWVWLDGGGGRVMLFSGQEAVITKEIPVAAKNEPAELDSAALCWCHAASGIYETLA